MRSSMHKAVITLALLVALALAIACAPVSSGLPGVSCTQSSDCGSGLQCLADSLPEDGGGCVSVGMECLKPCSSEEDCTATLGSGYFCSQGTCGASIATCQPEAEVDAGPDADAASMSDAPATSDGAHD
jgi:hypothetical protein